MDRNNMLRTNNDIEIPVIGLGVYQSRSGQETQSAVTFALNAGYRHIDTAMIYMNEKDVGQSISQSNIAREEIFITTKLWNNDQGYDKTLFAFEKSLKNLGSDYIDLYLMHWPVADLRLESWKAMERLLMDGRCRAIGVSNFMVRHLQELLDNLKVPPAVNQIELSPYNYQHRKEIIDLCRQHHILLEAYSPLTKGIKLSDPSLIDISKKYHKTTAQLLIRWGLEHQFIVLPKSVRRERIQQNLDVFNFSISKKDMAVLNGLNENLATGWDPTTTP